MSYERSTIHIMPSEILRVSSAKAAAQNEIDQHTAQFLARGGCVTVGKPFEPKPYSLSPRKPDPDARPRKVVSIARRIAGGKSVPKTAISTTEALEMLGIESNNNTARGRFVRDYGAKAVKIVIRRTGQKCFYFDREFVEELARERGLNP